MKLLVLLPKTMSNDLNIFTDGLVYLEDQGHHIIKYVVGTEDNFIDSLNNCDAVLYENLLNDFSTGYIISKALTLKKIVICLTKERKKEKKNVDSEDKNMLIRAYTKDSIKKELDKALKEASSKLDSKFILIIPSEIDRYLEWSSKSRRMHKAQIVREALEQVMKKDREYRNTLESK